jgi:asparagine synthetase B (glutamine-hydrolysing)
MSAASIETIAVGPLRMSMRAAVAMRSAGEQGSSLLYLSLFDDEIDGRFDEFLACQPPEPWGSHRLEDAALCLEPTDVVIQVDPAGSIGIARGGVCNFPLYWTKTGQSIHISTVLPIDDPRQLSVEGLLIAIAVVSVTYQNEPNLVTATPLQGWSRFRRGAVSRWDVASASLAESPIDLAACTVPNDGRTGVIRAIRAALEKFGQRQAGREQALLELSGGFDSTLAALAARAANVRLKGVSLHFPYYEFRYEDHIQQAVARDLQLSRLVLEGADVFAYTPPDWWPRLDEPATRIITLKRELDMTRIAVNQQIDRVLVGEGGDQVFSEDLLEPVPASVPLARAAFSSQGWQTIEGIRAEMDARPYYLRRSTLTYLHDARLDVALKESFGTHTRSPFSDLDMIRAGMGWAHLSAQLGVREGKKILVEAFADKLPEELLARRSKVSWDGVCARTYAAHGGSIIQEIEKTSPVLEHLGINPRWIIERVGALSRWEITRFGEMDREVFAVYALSTWLQSWNIEKPSDCCWTN